MNAHAKVAVGGTLALFTLLAAACTKPTTDVAPPDATAALVCSPDTQPGVDGGCASTAAPEPSASAEVADAEADEPPPPPGKCPNPNNVDGLYRFDWQKQFPLSADVAARVKGIAGTAAETKTLSAELETELRATCTKMAAELGVKDSFASATLACGAATTALKQLRAKLAPGKVQVTMRPPTCTTPLEPFGACLAKCDAVLDASTPETSCAGHAPVGKCSGICEGACEAPAGKCSGTCTGACESGFHGTCKGTCTGTCDGKSQKAGTCAGTCDGACDGGGHGECKSVCEGACETHAEVCSGTCLGKCSVDVKDARCTGVFKATGATEECRAYCETRSDRHATCGATYVSVSVDGAKDAASAKTFQTVLEHHLAAVARIGQGLASRITAAENNGKVVAAGVKVVTQASDSDELRAVTPCLSSFVAPATEGALGLKSTAAAAAAILAAAK